MEMELWWWKLMCGGVGDVGVHIGGNDRGGSVVVGMVEWWWWWWW